MLTNMDKLYESVAANGPVCVGLDTEISYLPTTDTAKTAGENVVAFNRALIDATKGVAGCYKVQIAYYEMYGVPGMQAFVDTCAYAKSKGLVVIGDAKRNDIGATSGAYANAFLGETPLGDKTQSAFPVDFVTVNAYLGSDGILPFLKASEVRGGGIFALVKTSNPSGVELQDLMIGDRHVYEVMGDLVSKWGESCIGAHGYSSVGAVVGATYPEQGAALRVRLPHTFFLVPGYGAQGATGKDLRGCFDENGMGAVVNASRSILTAWKKQPGVDFAQAAYNEAIRMRDDIMEGM